MCTATLGQLRQACMDLLHLLQYVINNLAAHNSRDIHLCFRNI